MFSIILHIILAILIFIIVFSLLALFIKTKVALNFCSDKLMFTLDITVKLLFFIKLHLQIFNIRDEKGKLKLLIKFLNKTSDLHKKTTIAKVQDKVEKYVKKDNKLRTKLIKNIGKAIKIRNLDINISIGIETRADYTAIIVGLIKSTLCSAFAIMNISPNIAKINVIPEFSKNISKVNVLCIIQFRLANIIFEVIKYKLKRRNKDARSSYRRRNENYNGTAKTNG